MAYQGCERRVISVRNGATLYHYLSKEKKEKVAQVPILIIYAFVNTPKILDLTKERSFIGHLLKQQLDVYLLEWQNPQLNDCTRSLADYILQDLDDAVHQVCENAAINKIHLMGICQGGYLSLCYSALKPDHLQSFIPMVTPVNFDVPRNRVFQLSRYFDLDQLVNKFSNVPGWCISWFLQQIEPLRSQYKHWRAVRSLDKINEFTQALTQWEFDCPAQAGSAFLEFGQQCVQQNALVKGNLLINNQPVLLANLTIPILNIYASQDHFWPVATVSALKENYQGCHYQEHIFEGGHIGVFISKRALNEVPKIIQAWVGEH